MARRQNKFTRDTSNEVEAKDQDDQEVLHTSATTDSLPEQPVQPTEDPATRHVGGAFYIDPKTGERKRST